MQSNTTEKDAFGKHVQSLQKITTYILTGFPSFPLRSDHVTQEGRYVQGMLSCESPYFKEGLEISDAFHLHAAEGFEAEPN